MKLWRQKVVIAVGAVVLSVGGCSNGRHYRIEIGSASDPPVVEIDTGSITIRPLKIIMTEVEKEKGDGAAEGADTAAD